MHRASNEVNSSLVSIGAKSVHFFLRFGVPALGLSGDSPSLWV